MVFPTHDPTNLQRLAEIKLYITSKTGSNITISYGGLSNDYLVQANTVFSPVSPIRRDIAYIEESQSNTVIKNKAIHIKVKDGDGKIAVYAHIFAGFRSAASLILPVEALGQKYYSMNYTQRGPGHNFLVVAATEPNTKLLIHHGPVPIKVTLEEAGDVYQYIPAGTGADLTGVYIEIDPASADNCTKRFAVFSGSTSAIIGFCGTSRDPLYQQLYPTSSWGRTYGIVPFIDRLHIIRIVAQEDNTIVQFNGRVLTLNKGTPYESEELSGAGFITADKNISVAQYSLSQCSGSGGASLLGDPEMVLLNPIEFNINDVTLFSSTDEAILERYINVCMKTSATGSFMINGQQVGFRWTPIPSNPEYSYMQLQISDTHSTLAASEGFNAIAYGFGQTESYAYSAGTTLAANNYLRILNRVTNTESENACVDQSSDFKIFLPMPAEKITWMLDEEEPVAFNAPTPTDILTDGSGTKTYEYTYVYGKVFTELRQHDMVVNVTLPTSSSCIGNEYEYVYKFDVEPIPVANFGFNDLGCELAGTVFTDLSDSKLPDKAINKWIWDFGDGTELVFEKNPVHRFPATGAYDVKLSVATAEGCLSDVLVKTVHITVLPSPVVVFDPIPDICANGGIVTVKAARETKGVSGRGVYSGAGITPEGVFDPQLAGVGIHHITYTYRGDQTNEENVYCEAIKTQTIRVNPVPVIEELERDLYILSGGTKQFKARDASPKSSYQWAPSVGLDRDNVLNPIITGEVDRVYTLTSTTLQGCVSVDTIHVHVLDDIKIANAFSPNGDGINDVWNIEHIDSYPNVTVQVFNRYGAIVFSSKGYAKPFDGRYQNNDLATETYFYVIDPGNGKARKTGAISIIR